MSLLNCFSSKAVATWGSSTRSWNSSQHPELLLVPRTTRTTPARPMSASSEWKDKERRRIYNSFRIQRQSSPHFFLIFTPQSLFVNAFLENSPTLPSFQQKFTSTKLGELFKKSLHLCHFHSNSIHSSLLVVVFASAGEFGNRERHRNLFRLPFVLPTPIRVFTPHISQFSRSQSIVFTQCFRLNSHSKFKFDKLRLQ